MFLLIQYNGNDGNKADFENVKSFGKYKFYLPEEIKPEKNIAYVVSIDNDLDIDYYQWKTTWFKKFVVLESKE